MSVETYQCQECGLHYETEDLAKACYEYCSEHQACSVEIMSHSLEHRKESAEASGE